MLEKKGGKDFFPPKKRGAKTFLSAKKRGRKLFGGEKEGGRNFFYGGKILKTRPGYPINFDRSLKSSNLNAVVYCNVSELLISSSFPVRLSRLPRFVLVLVGEEENTVGVYQV